MTPIIYLIQSGTIWEAKFGEEFVLHEDICNLASGFLVTGYISFLQSPCTQGQNMRPNRVSHIYI